MITLENYFEKKDLIDWSKVSDVTKEGIADIELLIETAIDVPETLEVEEVQAEISLFLAEINKALKKKITKRKSRAASVAKPKKTEKKSVPKRVSTKSQIDNTTYFKRLIPYNQKQALIEINSHKHDSIIERVEKELASIPKTQQRDNIQKSTVYAHYFHGATDWYITDIAEDRNMLFGYVILNGDTQNAEAGYISIEELTQARGHEFTEEYGVTELDFFFEKDILENILYKQYPNYYSNPKQSRQVAKATSKKTSTKTVKKVVDVTMVNRYSTQYRLIRRFYNLVRLHQTTSFRKIQLLYLAFQKAAIDRSVRKTDAEADLFTKINTKVVSLFDTVNPTKSDADIEFTDKKLFRQIEEYVKGQKINYAVTLLKSYISLQGLKPDTQKVERLIKRIDNATSKGKIKKTNRLYKQLIDAKSALENYLEKPTVKIEPEQIGLSLPARSLCTNRVKCTGLRKDGKLYKGYRFINGGAVIRVKKKAV